ncbi:galectin-4-like [Wyeomyia smithii]|uniref:galectin-4-like n=1 Tax=Wyeomyia smithii TaxID=174621 RepID=UPI002467DAE8|nr:galectin-4-like [Wyeomyia smithii]
MGQKQILISLRNTIAYSHNFSPIKLKIDSGFCSPEVATIPIFNPVIPSLGEIPGGLYPGKNLYIRGQITGNDMFNINIQSGAAVKPRDDTLLHISLRPASKLIVFNTYISGEWQQEEQERKVRIAKSKPFEMLIKVKKSHYTIKIDGKKIYKFTHRLVIHVGEGGVIESITEKA